MKSYQAKAPTDKEPKSAAFIATAVGGGAFLVGAALAFGYVQWNTQQQKLAQMSQMVEEMRAQPALAAAPTPAPSQTPVVARDTPVDLLAPAPAAFAQPVATAAVDPTLVTHTAAQPLPEDLARSTAEKLRALVASSASAPAPAHPDANFTPTLDEKAISDARRLETLAIIHADVQELVGAVVKGDYDIHTDYEDERFSSRIHFVFVGHEEAQTALEVFLSQAAEKGIVAHSDAVVDSDGKVNGNILLFDLVERALENGTPEEQRAGQKMRREAVAILAKDETVGASANADGERFYTVESGDSLAFIALQFYGNTNDYVRIFDANRNKINSPDRIRVGQRLVIPKA